MSSWMVLRRNGVSGSEKPRITRFSVTSGDPSTCRVARWVPAYLGSAGAASVTQADIIGASAGAYYWKQSWDGDVQSGPDSIDTKKDLGYDEDNGNSIYVALEHPVPVLPNIRLQRTDIEISESNQLSRNFTFEGDTYTVADTVDSTTDLTHTDATFYYELLDNWVNLDLGLTVRMFDGEVRLATTGREGSIELDAPVPMLYANARFNLPLTGLYAQAVGNVISVSFVFVVSYCFSLFIIF